MRSVVATFVIAGTSLAVACSAPPGEFSTGLGKVVRTDRAAEVDLSSVLPLEWNELYAFGPYSVRENSCEILRLGWLRCHVLLPSAIEEHEFFLVFRLREEVVHTEHHWRWNGDFNSQVQKPQPILRSSAKFGIKLVSNRAPDGQQWYQLEHLGSAQGHTE
jgi:hypothetical protein